MSDEPDDDPPGLDEVDQHTVKAVEAAIRELMKHFDSVQVFVTRHDAADGVTMNHADGEGNWFARYGQVACWVDAVIPMRPG